MKSFYTDETFTYVVTTVNKSSGDNASCKIPMLALLPNDVEYFICVPLYFQSTSNLFSIPSSSAVILEAKDFVETGYSTHKTSSFKAVTPPLFGSDGGIHRLSLVNNINQMKYVVRNFNNKTIQFTFRNATGIDFPQNVTAQGGWAKQWILHLSLTPIREQSPCKYIISNTHKSFTYTITNKGADGSANDCYITLPPIHDNYNRYFVDVIDFSVDNSTIDSGSVRYINLYSFNWAENGYGGYNSQTDRMIVCSPYIRNANEPSLYSGDGAVFMISNMKQSRRVRFKMYEATQTEVASGDVDSGATTYYYITCKITPID